MRMTKLVNEAVQNFPAGHAQLNYHQIDRDFGETRRFFGSFYVAFESMAGVTTGSASILTSANYIAAPAIISSSKDPILGKWQQRFIEPIQKIQAEDSSIDFVCQRIGKFNSAMPPKFEKSVKEYRLYRAGSISATAAATSIRNVLTSLNGEIRALALKREPARKNKIQARNGGWHESATIIARGAPASAQVAQLSSQEETYDRLHAKLSVLSKDREKLPSADWEARFSQYVGMVHAIVGLVDFLDGS